MTGKVDEYMRKSIARITVTLDTPMLKVIKIMIEENTQAIIVTNADHELEGIITGTDTLREMARNIDSPVLRKETARNVMTTPPISVPTGTFMIDAKELMFKRGIHTLVVTKGFTPIGYLTQPDFDRWWLEEHAGANY